MSEYYLGKIEEKFAQIIWENEPIPSGALAKKANEVLGWKKSTSYTVLRRLCEKGIFENTDGTVKSLMSKEELDFLCSEKVVDDMYSGSLPAFVAAFSKRKKMSAEELEELKRIIEEYEVK